MAAAPREEDATGITLTVQAKNILKFASYCLFKCLKQSFTHPLVLIQLMYIYHQRQIQSLLNLFMENCDFVMM